MKQSAGSPTASAHDPGSSAACSLPSLTEQMARLFQRLGEAGVEKHFHPHPLTREEAFRRARYTGQDLYYALLDGGEVAGYGMLRGWDEGYEVPALGIAVDPAAQGRGYGRLLMQFLHAAARARGAKAIRLKVYADNTPALALYRSLGYVFRDEQDGQQLGILELGDSPS